MEAGDEEQLNITKIQRDMAEEGISAEAGRKEGERVIKFPHFEGYGILSI